jgi:hypothetical protein
MANIRITKLVHEHVDAPYSSGGLQSFGQMIDSMIAAALANGDQMHEINFNIEESEWHKMLTDFHGETIKGESQAQWAEAYDAPKPKRR